MLIIEGTDLVGKTTLAELLVKRLSTREDMRLSVSGPYQYAWFDKLPPTWDYFFSYLPAMRRFVVQDRFHMSEIVYREARGEPAKLYPETYRMLDGKLRLLGAFTVVVTADPDIIRNNFGTREEMHGLDVILRANELFLEIVEGDGCAGWTFEAHDPDVDVHYHACVQNGFPSSNEKLVEEIIDKYTTRQRILNKLLASKESWNETLD